MRWLRLAAANRAGVGFSECTIRMHSVDTLEPAQLPAPRELVPRVPLAIQTGCITRCDRRRRVRLQLLRPQLEQPVDELIEPDRSARCQGADAAGACLPGAPGRGSRAPQCGLLQLVQPGDQVTALRSAGGGETAILEFRQRPAERHHCCRRHLADQDLDRRTGVARRGGWGLCILHKSMHNNVGPMLLGYARVSTDAQSLEAKMAALKAAGCERIYAEKRSGAETDRKALAKLMKESSPGDTVVVTRLDRLARSTRSAEPAGSARSAASHCGRRRSTPPRRRGGWWSTSWPRSPSSSAS